MHSAPAVDYPVGRSNFQAWVIGLTAALGGLAGLLWGRQPDLAAWRQWLLALTLLATWSVATFAWLRFACGRLSWDGERWSWTTAQVSVCGTVTVHLDWQSGLLVSLCARDGQRIWLWPQRRAEMARWHALRCAIFSNGALAQERVQQDGSRRLQR